MDWSGKRILVTAGASFISSHVIDQLVRKGARRIRVVDDLSSGTLQNIREHVDDGVVEVLDADLLKTGVAESACAGIDHVFHLAAIHGGRGYVDMHQAECSRNLVLDGLLISAAHR